MTLPPAYSKRFVTFRNGAPTTPYVIPEGKVGVVTCFSGLLHSFEPLGCIVALLGYNGETIAQFSYTPKELEAEGQGRGFLWYGRAVYYHGDPIEVVIPEGNADGQVSGYLLSAE